MNTFHWKKLNTKEYINLEETLFSGQVFHFKKIKNNIYKGVLQDTVVTLKQENKNVFFLNNTLFIEQILINFFNLNVETNLMNETGLRFLTNDFYSTVFSFICSANNNIKRITRMVNFLYTKGNLLETLDENQYISDKTSDDRFNIENPSLHKFYSFPSLHLLIDIENELKAQKFGYRAVFICNTAKFFINNSINWNQLSYSDSKKKLMEASGIGNKVADCICLIALKHFQAVPIDTHIFKYSKNIFNLNFIKLTYKNYQVIQKKWIEKYGNYAGIAQLYAFKEYLNKKPM